MNPALTKSYYLMGVPTHTPIYILVKGVGLTPFSLRLSPAGLFERQTARNFRWY